MIRTRREDADFDSEIASHIQLEADRIRDERGMSAEDALAEARRRFGNVTSHRERYFESRRWMPLERLVRDARLALRRLIREPRFTATAVATIALCLGGNLAIFAAVDAVLVRPLPFPNADRLVTIYNTYPKAGVMDDGASVANYYERHGQLRTLTDVALLRHTTAIVGDAGATEREDVTVVTPEFFTALGVRPALGRLLTDADMDGTRNPVVIITDAAWRRYFNADPLAVGKTLRVNGMQLTVAGVLPASFRFLSSNATIYAAYVSRPDQRETSVRHSGSNSQMIARLAPGASIRAAQAEIDDQNAVLERQDPQAEMMANVGFRSVVVSLHERHVESVRPMLVLLQIGALSLLLIGAVNLVNLLLVRAAGRSKEAAVRTAIGAGRWDLARGVFVETLVVAVVGGLAGLIIAAGGVRAFVALGADRLPLGATISLDWWTIAAGLAAAVVTGVLMAVPVAWFTIRGGLPIGLHAYTRGGTASRGLQRLRHGFVVAQVGLAFVLLSGAGLLSLSFERVMAAPKGFQPEHTLTGHLTLPVGVDRLRGGYLRADRAAFVRRLVEAIDREPGVIASGMASNVPLSGDDLKSAATVPGVVQSGSSGIAHASYSYWVSSGYFKAMGLKLAAGRVFDQHDADQNARVAVIDTDFARRNFPDEMPLGHRVFLGSNVGPDDEAFTIVGVIDAAKQSTLTDESQQGAVYYPTEFYTNNQYFVVVRSAGDVQALAPTIGRIVRSLDPELPVSDIKTMEARVNESVGVQRSPALITTVFAALALLLATIGTHGVISYAVAERRREIGLRLALGAQPSAIRRQFLSLGGRLLVIAAIPGLAGAWLAGRLLETWLFGVPPFDPLTIAVVAVLMTSVMAIACLAPSRRAARISPMVAMTEDA